LAQVKEILHFFLNSRKKNTYLSRNGEGNEKEYEKQHEKDNEKDNEKEQWYEAKKSDESVHNW